MNRLVALAIGGVLVGIGLSIPFHTRTTAQVPSSASPGRYQVATSYRDAGNWVFVTVIDTSTGKIVTQERHSGFGRYTEVR